MPPKIYFDISFNFLLSIIQNDVQQPLFFFFFLVNSHAGNVSLPQNNINILFSSKHNSDEALLVLVNLNRQKQLHFNTVLVYEAN